MADFVADFFFVQTSAYVYPSNGDLYVTVYASAWEVALNSPKKAIQIGATKNSHLN